MEQLVRFHKNEFDEMLCKLDSSEFARSFRTNSNPALNASSLTVSLPGPWRARRLDSADVDSRVWLTSTRTYIAFVILFMV